MLRGVSSKEPMQEGGCAVVRQGPLIAVVGTFVIAVLVLGCGAGGPGNNHGSGGKRSALATKEENTAPEGDRSKAQTAQEPLGLDAKVVSPLGQANLPAGYGEGSLWATDFEPISAACDDVVLPGEGPCSASASSATSASPAGEPVKTLLKRVDPRTGEVVAAIPLEGFAASFPEVAFGAGSVWVSSSGYSSKPGGMLRVDPRMKRVVDRIPVAPPPAWLSGMVRCG